MQGLSSEEKVSSSMYFGDVLSSDLAHLDEKVAYISCMH